MALGLGPGFHCRRNPQGGVNAAKVVVQEEQMQHGDMLLHPKSACQPDSISLSASLRDIARTARLPRSNLYYYFSSKRHIYRRIITEMRNEWIKAFEQITLERGPKEAIADYIKQREGYRDLGAGSGGA